MLDPNKQRMQPGIVRFSKCTFRFCKSVFCDVQSAFFTFCCLVMLAFWVTSCILGDAPQEEFDPITIPDADPLKPLPPKTDDLGLL